MQRKLLPKIQNIAELSNKIKGRWAMSTAGAVYISCPSCGNVAESADRIDAGGLPVVRYQCECGYSDFIKLGEWSNAS